MSIAALESAFDDTKVELINAIDDILIEEGMNAFVLWGNAFPKRHLRFVSGMGTCTFACTSLDAGVYIDLDRYCDDEAERNSFFNTRSAAMLKPLTDFYDLFWSSEHYPYPAFSDIIYNPVTRTVECGDKVIYLDKES